MVTNIYSHKVEPQAESVAPFALRCGAALIDYTLIVLLLALSVLAARVASPDSGSLASEVANTLAIFLVGAAIVLNFGVLAGLTGRTLGKWITGLRVARKNGAPIGVTRMIVRHTLGYLISFLIFGAGFLLAAIHPRGRALHDLLLGTIVVRGSATQRRARQQTRSRAVASSLNSAPLNSASRTRSRVQER